MRLRYLLPAIFLIVPACSTTPPAPPANWKGVSILPKGESIAVLNARANDPANSQADRARAIFTLFAWHIHPGASAPEVHEALTDTAWLPETDLYLINVVSGLVPIELKFGDTAFVLRLFPADAKKEWSPWVIYFRLSGKLEEEDALAFLRGEKVDVNPKLQEFALCFPNTKNPGHLAGRVEIFSKRGIHVWSEW